MNLKRTLKSERETIQLARELADEIKGHVVLMNGTLGAGKTFFVKAFADHFHCPETSSPTFTIHQRYEGDITIHHFDLYRLESMFELENIDFYEFVDSGETCFIEWAEKFNLHDELEKYIEITITVDSPTERTFEITKVG